MAGIQHVCGAAANGMAVSGFNLISGVVSALKTSATQRIGGGDWLP